ncbi:tRNA (adenosine(37)-N6)-dimethylallyltransferase MiaA [Limosilactobacillus mucosae]|uniref:tRNA (adenosine(37)-N6)-dimethylallyltransferase MiaA n=1 Tax=Lactobacillus sp. MRS-253-APC-2B TaxID=2725305 RepID=UPI00146F860B|nr:tRNA (adenosine(37)-N6)-dimethylallyltransferase MiaA [Lactobacillus sp. MRS-253-APC-2B]MDD6454231.1 tRNA (adenosine(37)-N6)-dimethylallyltransferase MiaA [Lactobacillus sp.]MDD6865683.1 tRNA (adenosine(37)-N6)-dimethylallyltransferase MiaA [Lactobacillus sp.]MDD6893609.1 tRNA (adenosine(37)-N6)-dimethylallyltransferase MiaA [Lactobacillus sp.]NME34040.1 tRNA (adenosine(37)-N6)-dimethylallyltransferase MiaA [Lactobacillus sp. MRS-253-APC-2B]
MTKAIAIVGPTAVGKTALSIQLAHDLNGEVISGDSMQIYRHLDIGTAKITPAEMDGVPHHLIDIRDLNQRFSAAEFQKLANEQIDQIAARQHLPMVVGGTGFYLQTLTENLALGADHFDEQSQRIRDYWHQMADQKGPEAVWKQLYQKDPQAAKQIPVGNLRRVIRALEVIEKTGQLFSQQTQTKSDNEFLLIGLTTERSVLYERINQRVDLMIKEGLLDEARWLYEQGGENYQSGKGIGYRELFPYFKGETTLADAIAKIKQDSRHYAKRQLTWFRNKMNVQWYDLVSGRNTTNEIEADVKEWLKN